MSNIKSIAVGISRNLDLWWNIYSKKINMVYKEYVENWFQQDSMNISKDFNNSLNNYVKRW